MLELLTGMVASGKSTWAKQRAKDGWVILNDDAIVTMVHGGFHELYQEAWKPLYKSIEDHIFYMSVAMGKNLVIDRGVNVSASSRVRWIALARCLDTAIRAVSFEVFSPETHATRRHASDPRGHSYEYWLRVAEVHAARYDVPQLSEGFAEIIQKKWTV